MYVIIKYTEYYNNIIKGINNVQYKTTLLSSAIWLFLLSIGTLSHAQGGIRNVESSIGGYGEIGGNIDFLDLENFKTEDKDLPEQFTIKKARGVSGGVGVVIDTTTMNGQNAVSLGLDISHISPEVIYDFLGGTDEKDGVDYPNSHKWGHLDMDIYLTKMTLEHFFNSHFSLYGSLGVGIGEKVYFGKNKGIYLKAGINYMRVLKVKTDLMHKHTVYYTNTHTIADTRYSEIKLSDGMATGEVELKIGYKF